LMDELQDTVSNGKWKIDFVDSLSTFIKTIKST